MTRIHPKLLTAGVATGLWLGIGTAFAGPCTAEIDRMARALEDPTGKALGTLSGGAPGAIQHEAPMPEDEAAAGPSGKEQGTLAGPKPGAETGAIDPAEGKATSAQDVRLQQQGRPTMAQGGDPRAAEERFEQAEAALERARTLDEQGDEECMAALEEAHRLIVTTE